MRVETLGKLKVRIVGGVDREGGGDGPLVVLLHGFGAPGDDLVALHRVLDVPREVRFAFPEAPLDLAGLGMGGASRAWWMIDMMAMQKALDEGRVRDLTADVPRGLADAHEWMTETLDLLQEKLGASGDKTILGGFSQGSMLSVDIALRSSRALAGVVIMSGTLLAAHEWVPLMSARKGLRVLQSHGAHDPLLPMSIAERLRDHLSEAGCQVKWIPFRGGHEIPNMVLDGLSSFLREVV